MAATIVLLPILGMLGDRIPSTVIIPVTFTARAICGYGFYFIDKPDSVWSIVLCTLLIVFSIIESISIDVLFMKRMPSEVRGTMTGVFALFGQVGLLIFTCVGGQLYDKVSPSAPFVFLAIMDTCLVILTMVLIACGKLKSS